MSTCSCFKFMCDLIWLNSVSAGLCARRVPAWTPTSLLLPPLQARTPAPSSCGASPLTVHLSFHLGSVFPGRSTWLLKPHTLPPSTCTLSPSVAPAHLNL